MIFEQFSLTELLTIAKPFIIFLVGMIIYAFFIFKFYRFLARRDIFHIKKGGLHPVLYVLAYIFLYPVIAFLWFIIMSILLVFLAKEQAVQNVLLISITLITAVRATAYHSEDLSRDLAKMLPFALLGIFLVDITYFSFDSSINMLVQLPSLWRIMVYYLIFIIAIEFVLRIVYSIARPKGKPEKKK